MITNISWNEIFKIWKDDLWPGRTIPIEPTSAMNFRVGYDMKNMEYMPTFFGYVLDKTIVGVNSGHGCVDTSYRSRGLWVHPNYRKQGIGQRLLKATIDQARIEKCNLVWSYPRYTSWKTYQSVGFELASEWEIINGQENAYATLIL
jgi:GNAT superfamily N-acetyltransferase